MAASYQTGGASTPIDLLQKIVSFLAGQGWTTDASSADGLGWKAHLHKGAIYANFRAAYNERIWPDDPSGNLDRVAGYGIGFYLGSGYSGASAWHKQAGRPTRFSDGSTLGAGMNLPSGSIAAYHFFDNGEDHITLVVEKSPGIFVVIGWGPALSEAGGGSFPYFFGSSSPYRNTDTATGGGYPGVDQTCLCPMTPSAYESYSSSGYQSLCFVKVDSGTNPYLWLGNGTNDYNEGWFWTGGWIRHAIRQASTGIYQEGQWPNFRPLIGRAYQVAFPGALLLPLHSFTPVSPGGRWAPLGAPPSVFYCEAVGNGWSAGEVWQVAGADYMVFPGFAVFKGA